MSKVVKVFLLISVALILVGGVICAIGFANGGMNSLIINRNGIKVLDYSNTTDIEKVDSTYTGIKNIDVDVYTLSRIKIMKGDELTVKAQNPKIFGGIKAKTEGDTLKVTSSKGNIGIPVFGFIGIDFNGIQKTNVGSINITVPENIDINKVSVFADMPKVSISDLDVADLHVSCDLGSLTIMNTNATKLSAKADYGTAKLVGCKADNLTVRADMGSLKMDNVTAGYADVKLNSGEAKFSGFEANGMKLTCDMGSVNISGILNGISDINCNMGSIKLNLNQPKDSLSLNLDTDLGAAYVNDSRFRRGQYTSQNPEGVINAYSDMGSIHVNFKQ